MIDEYVKIMETGLLPSRLCDFQLPKSFVPAQFTHSVTATTLTMYV